MEVVKDLKPCWEDLGVRLGLRLDGLQQFGVVIEYVKYYPTPSWKQVAETLQQMKRDKLADYVTTKYVRGMHVTLNKVDSLTSNLTQNNLFMVCVSCDCAQSNFNFTHTKSHIP